MPFIVHSPFDGEPVKVRDEDIGRALRDKQKRIFYALPKSSGDGYYSSPTRQGGLKDEQRYERLMQSTVKAADNVREEAAAVHDATGRRRSGKRRGLVVLILLLILLAAAYYAYKQYGDRIERLLPNSDDAGGRSPDQAALVIAET